MIGCHSHTSNDPVLPSISVEDWELHVGLASECEFVNVPRVVGCYRKSENCLTGDSALLEQSFLTVRSKIFSAAPDEYRDLKPEYAAAFYRHLATGSLNMLRFLNPVGAVRLAVPAFFR